MFDSHLTAVPTWSRALMSTLNTKGTPIYSRSGPAHRMGKFFTIFQIIEILICFYLAIKVYFIVRKCKIK